MTLIPDHSLESTLSELQKGYQQPNSHAPRILVLYGSLRPESNSRKLALNAAQMLEQFGAEVRVFDPEGLPVCDRVSVDHPKVVELRELAQWSEGMVWCSPEIHGAVSSVFKNQIDWIPLSEGAIRPTQGKTLAVMQVNGGSQSFNVVNALRVLGRWMRMFTIPNQSSVPKAFQEFDADGQMKDSPYRDRVVDVMEELFRMTLLLRNQSAMLTHRFSENKADYQARVDDVASVESPGCQTSVLRLIHQHSQPTVLASGVLTLALVSDSVLYLLLPLYFEDFGLTLIWVGILLSANRFVRLLINPWLLPWFERFGPRTSMLQAVALATAASLAFLMLSSPWVLLLARLLWGMAYALMRLGCLHYATHQPERRMVNLGWYTSLQEVGPLSVLLIAPWLVQFIAIEAVLVLASALCLVALWPALALPRAQSDPQSPTRARFPWPNAWHRLTFVLCLLFDGVWTVVLAPLLVVAGWSTAAALAITAWLLLAKRLFNLLVGVVSIRVNPWVPERLWLGISLALMLVAGVLMALTEVLWASGFAITGHGLYMILVPKRLADEALSDGSRHHSLNGFTFWRDLAAATGALLASLLLAASWTPMFYGLLTGLVALMLLSARYGVISSTSN